MPRSRRFQRNSGHPSYKGGYTRIANGYIWEYCPDHPAAKYGMVLQHRLVMEDKIGRYLTDEEQVHHLDRNKANNNPANLQLMGSNAEHRALHNREDRTARLTEDQVREALQGRTTLEAAKLLGVHHQTLRNRFDYLLAKRRSPHRYDEEQTVALVRQAAADPTLDIKTFARQSGIGASLTKAICEANGIVWVKKSRKGEKHRTYRRKTATRKESASGDQ